MDEIKKLALETLQQNKQAIVFAPSRASAEKTAEDISKLTAFNQPELEKSVLRAASTPTKQCRRLSLCLKKGIAFHHAGLLQKQKELIEEEFREGKVRIICATPTLAMGLSLPAFRVIIKSLKRYSGKWGMDWIPVLEYLQMAGRAGRPEYEKFGEAIAIAKNEQEKEEIFYRYIRGEPEEIYSKLAAEPVLRTYLLSLISSGIIRDKKTMNDFFAQTFWAHQFQDMHKLEGIMEKTLRMLQEWNFVDIEGLPQSNNDFISASSLADDSHKDRGRKLKPTIVGRRISELYLDPLTAKHLLDCLKKYNNNHNTFSLLQMICHTLEMRPLLRIKSKQQDYIQEELNKNYEIFLEEEPNVFDLEHDEFLQSVKTALFFTAWIEEHDEDYLLEKFDVCPGEIRVKLEIADWLLYASAELAKIKNHKEAIKEIHKLRLRVKTGVKEELLPLLKLKGIGRIRARKLYLNGLRDLGNLKKIDPSSLSQLLGKNVALKVKEQLGEEIKIVPKLTRKGQLSLGKFISTKQTS